MYRYMYATKKQQQQLITHQQAMWRNIVCNKQCQAIAFYQQAHCICELKHAYMYLPGHEHEHEAIVFYALHIYSLH